MHRITIKSIKNLFFNGVSIGSLSGLIIGMGINNSISFKITHKKEETTKYYKISNPIVTTIAGGLIPSVLFITSPLIVYNYFTNSSIGDKLFDSFKEHMEKNYIVNYNRFYQYDGHDNKYAFPSHIEISIIKSDNHVIKNNHPTD